MMHYMRTTIDFPDDLHRSVSNLARDRNQTLSQAVTELLRSVLSPRTPSPVRTDDRTNLPVVSVGRVVTTEDVRSLEDEA